MLERKWGERWVVIKVYRDLDAPSAYFEFVRSKPQDRQLDNRTDPPYYFTPGILKLRIMYLCCTKHDFFPLHTLFDPNCYSSTGSRLVCFLPRPWRATVLHKLSCWNMTFVGGLALATSRFPDHHLDGLRSFFDLRAPSTCGPDPVAFPLPESVRDAKGSP